MRKSVKYDLNKGKLVALDTTKNLLNRIEKKKITLKLSEKIDLKDNELETLKILSLTHKEQVYHRPNLC